MNTMRSIKRETVVLIVVAIFFGFFFAYLRGLRQNALPEDWEAEIMTPELRAFFSAFDANYDNTLDWTEAMDFFYWVKQNIMYRYDDERHPEGLRYLRRGLITREQLGDGREGRNYWQKPMETLTEGLGIAMITQHYT